MNLNTKIVLIFTIVIFTSIGVIIALDQLDSSSATTFGFFQDTRIVDVNNQFAMDLYSEMNANNSKDNIFFSPVSISTAFAIAYEGAKGNTADEIQEVFDFSQDEDKRRNSFLSLVKDLNNEDNKEYKLRLANALWLANGFKPNDEYVQVAKDYYDSEVTNVDFNSDGIDKINGWVKDKTEGKIGQIFAPDPANAAIQLAITNAIYFKGTWTEQFDPEKTKVDDFYTDKNTTVKAPLMELKTAFLNQARTDQAKIVELPYEGDKVSMLVLLPKEIDGIKSLEESITKDNLKKWREDFEEIKTKVYLPKFKLETTYDMVPTLQKMGIYDAFENADFGKISDSNLFISKVIHNAFVEVNEEGTEAAAATGIAMLQSGPAEFRADHPFVFIIQEKETGQILFMGKVMDPTK